MINLEKTSFSYIVLNGIHCFVLPVPPKITSGPDDFSVMKGEDIHITCLFLSMPLPSVTWTQVDKTIKPSDKYEIEVTDQSTTLIVRNATEEDAAQFTLTLENPYGSDTFSVNVTVIGRYPL